MKTVNILGDNSGKFAGFFKFCKFYMCYIRLCIFNKHLVFVKLVKFLCISDKKNDLKIVSGGIIILLMIKSVYTSEIRDTAFGRDTGTAEEYYIITFVYPFLNKSKSFYQAA